MHPDRIGVFNQSRGGAIIQPNINSFEHKEIYGICKERSV